MCVLGLGLIGGSIMRATKAAGRDVFGYNRSVEGAHAAVAEGFDATTDITDTLRAPRAKHVLVVADSCYSGTLTRSIGVQGLANADALTLSRKRARTVMTSGGQEPVSDVGRGGRTRCSRRRFCTNRRRDSRHFWC